MNCKFQNIYINIISTIKKILSQDNILELKVKYLTSDGESALYNALKKVFPNTIIILCYYHYKFETL